MAILPAVTIAVMNDLHMGGTVGTGFQNPLMVADGRTIVNPAVDAINQANPDLVLIAGDLTQNASEEELGVITGCLARLNAPWVACKGNHDRETPEASARFTAAIGEHFRPGITRGSELGLSDDITLLVLDSQWGNDAALSPEGVQLAVPDSQLVEAALAELDRLSPALLVVVSHYPLVSQSAYVETNNGKYAGHVLNGEEILTNLTNRAGTVICFCGHNHYHHITSGERWLQCATGAMAEYPSEYRLVTIAGNAVQISTASASAEILAAAGEPNTPWVAGRPEDREFTWRPV